MCDRGGARLQAGPSTRKLLKILEGVWRAKGLGLAQVVKGPPENWTPFMRPLSQQVPDLTFSLQDPSCCLLGWQSHGPEGPAWACELFQVGQTGINTARGAGDARGG